MSIREELLEKAADNVGHMFRRRVEATPDHDAFLDPDRAPEGPNTWKPYTWRQSQVIVDRLAAGLLSRGLQYEQRVAIASSTRLEWIFVDLAIACAAGATTTIYPNTAREEFDYILTDSGSVVLFAEDKSQLDKALWHDVLDAQLHTIVLIDPDGVELNDRVISYRQLLDSGEAHLAEQPTAVDDAIASTSRETLSTLIYTSGTTGTPKGVRLNHISWVYEGIATKHLDVIEHTDLQYLWLPLSHVFGKALIACQLEYGFTSAVDGRIDRIVDGLGEVRPTFMCGAPRIFEKVRGAVMTGSKGVKARIARWAFAVGRDAVPYLSKGQELPRRLAIQHRLADRLVYSKLKEKLGGRIKFMISGSAKLSPQIQAWFFGAGIVIVEGYGSTETSAIACFDLPNPTLGTVGPPLPGIEFKIADDGEVLINGPIITPGYHNLPERTAEVLHDGWYATGDIGHLTDEGKLVITERKKDLFKTSGGKYVAPQKVEAAITANIPYISQAIAVGDGRKYCSALVVLDPQLLAKWAQRRGLEGLSYADLTQRSEIHASVEKQMEKANAKLERWETVKKFTILDHELTVENEGVTANMKIRRSIVTGKYQDLVDAMYPQED